MLHLEESSYEKEILNILAAQGGCIEGQNNLRMMRNHGEFHRTHLKKCLLKMEENKLIKINKKKYKWEICNVEHNFEKIFNEFSQKRNKIETRIYRRDLSDNEKFFAIMDFLDFSLQQNRELILSRLYSKCVFPNKKKVLIVKNANDKILNSMEERFNELDIEDKLMILDRLVHP